MNRTLTSYIYPAVEAASVAAECTAWEAPGEPVSFATALRNRFTPRSPGDAWGAPWGTTWLSIRADVPVEWRGRRTELIVELGFNDEMEGFQVEGIAYAESGEAVKALNPQSRWLPVEVGALDVAYIVEAASNPVLLPKVQDELVFAPTPLGDPATAGLRPQYVLGNSRLALVDEGARALIHDLEVLSELARSLPAESARRWEILVALEASLNVLDVHDVGATSRAARQALVAVLDQPAVGSAHILNAIGHAHIDSAWLWPLRETRRKVARTVANVLQLMDEDPDLLYAMSSAQQFAWLEEDHPDLFRRLSARFAEGRFLPVGGMWVESDVNMPSGESLVRQLVTGTRYFEEKFGDVAKVGWLPDSFGYSAALPQILKLAGYHRFITQKISWNTTNKFPHHTFWWEGIDGSRVLTHFPSADMYNSNVTVADVAHAASNFADKGWVNRSVLPFGFGDGGGGPTREMMERAARMRDLEGSARVEVSSPVKFFDQVEQEFADPQVWLGEMYLEFHRGIYTSQARTKCGNRRVEQLFREAELWATQARVRADQDYPFHALERLWQEVLVLQFHDVLPGTSIAWVHNEAEQTYARVESELVSIVESSLVALSGPGPGASIANASPFARSGVSGHSISTPVVRDGAVSAHSSDGLVILDNGVVRVAIAEDGTVVELTDLQRSRRVISNGDRGNLLRIYRDVPTKWDAWDIDAGYRATGLDVDSVVSARIEERGSRCAFVVDRAFGSSTASQEIVVTAGSAQVDFTTRVDWHERDRLLKVEFPLALSTERWAAETQFGHTYRTTHTNTSWDTAKFEACAHRWVHVGEPGYGVAVINDRTYGHSVRRVGSRDSGGIRTSVELSLVRGPRYPDPKADQGAHTFRYAVHVGADIEDAVRAGYEFTDSAREVSGGTPVPALAEFRGRGVVIDTVKMADDRSGDFIVRAYESLGARQEVQFSVSVDADAVYDVDLLENRICADLDLTQSLTFSPFQIRTFRVELSDAERNFEGG
ncbi:alpha-mannosidase [Paraoerskovia marina]|uniref:alpha-mannosidase n=1 Tax=Paraoerskovia marina TaxID=545619 RepID=UPI0018D4C66C|nr:glycoside hydrolase family 38 C-terminal domain-containing protein [Paraoerskovia marina]